MPDYPASCEYDCYYALASHTAPFVALLKGHVAGVRALRSAALGPSALRFASCADGVLRFGRERERDRDRERERERERERDRARRCIQDKGDDEAEWRRRARRARVFRPRFDPEGVRRLCGDVLDELA